MKMRLSSPKLALAITPWPRELTGDADEPHQGGIRHPQPHTVNPRQNLPGGTRDHVYLYYYCNLGGGTDSEDDGEC